MQTLTMQQIADLAGVQRPVVSMWRRRSASSDAPFPQPLAGAELRFDAREVAAWFEVTGRGNNGDAPIEAARYSSALDVLAADLDRASALLLLQDLRGEPFGDLDAEQVLSDGHHLRMDDLLPIDTLRSALTDRQLCATVDAVVEAAFSGVEVLTDLVSVFSARQGTWAGEALTAPALRLMADVISALYRVDERALVPVGVGGLMLAGITADHPHENRRPTVLRSDLGRPRSGEELAAWRRLAAVGCVTDTDELGAADVEGLVWLLQEQAPSDGKEFFGRIGDALADVGPSDVLVVVGPAALMIDPRGSTARRAFLAPRDDFVEPLRYVARLPKGLSRFGGRRRLALWVFSPLDSPWTAAGGLSDAALDEAMIAGLAADVVAMTTNDVDPVSHAFTSAVVRATDHFVRQSALTAPLPNGPRLAPAEVLAQVWELDRDRLLVDHELATSARGAASIPFTAATHELGRVHAGAKIPCDVIGAPTAGSATVIGPEEVRDPALLGSRAVDRLELERTAPQARLTQPGDVVYVGPGGPAAFVDETGGHVVQAPARIFRCRDAETDDRQLVPAVVAKDIAAQRGSDCSTWQLRLVPVDDVRHLGHALAVLDDRAAALRDELRSLNDLRILTLDGFADGSLTTLPAPRKAER